MARGQRRPKVDSGLAIPATPPRPKALAGLVTDSGAQARPVFSFALADCGYDGAWGWHLLSDPESRSLLDLMCEMARLTWAEVRRQTAGGRLRHHSMRWRVSARRRDVGLWSLSTTTWPSECSGFGWTGQGAFGDMSAMASFTSCGGTPITRSTPQSPRRRSETQCRDAVVSPASSTVPHLLTISALRAEDQAPTRICRPSQGVLEADGPHTVDLESVRAHQVRAGVLESTCEGPHAPSALGEPCHGWHQGRGEPNLAHELSRLTRHPRR